MMDTDKKVRRFTTSQSDLPQLLSGLQLESIISPSEHENLLNELSKPTQANAYFVTGVFKDIILLSNDNQQCELIISHNEEKVDFITLLPYRMSLLRQVEHWLIDKHSNEIIVMFVIELDEFSKINDVLEHSTGDLLLFQIARRLEKYIDLPSKLVRLHGDEFGLAVKGLDCIESAWKIAKWIEEQFELPFETQKKEIYLSPSIGFSAIPHVVDDQHGLIRTAYLALNKAKKDSTQMSHFYEVSFADDLHRDLTIESELNSALLEKQGLEAYYQPKQDLKTQKITGVEALIRWHHPTKGIVSPGHFIPIAELTGLICEVTDHIVDEVCKDIPRFRDIGFIGPVSINISARDFARKNFVSDICNILDRHNVQPCDIELEITEGAFISDFDYCCVILNSLREKGFALSIDDFGTGYSSLSYLRKLPIDVLKIDMSFVQEIEKDSSVRKIYTALINIADALNLKVVAEGVDKEEQKTVLTEIGCDLIQGYLLSKPMPAKQFCDLYIKSK